MKTNRTELQQRLQNLAKRELRRAFGWKEEEAYRWLRRRAMDTRRTIEDVCEQILHPPTSRCLTIRPRPDHDGLFLASGFNQDWPEVVKVGIGSFERGNALEGQETGLAG